MTELESDKRPIFEIAKEPEIQPRGLTAAPLHLRQHMLDHFDQMGSQTETVTHQEAGVAEFLANARLLFNEGEFDLAKDFYSSVLKINSRNELALMGLAECQSRTNEHEKAIETLYTLVETHATAAGYKMLGDELYHLEYFNDSIDAYLKALPLSSLENEDLFLVYKNLGNSYLKTGHPEAAEEFYNKAYSIHADSDVLLVNFASLALYRGDFEGALNRFREAVQINDKNFKAWTGLALIHREYGDMELSWANVEKALDIDPENSSAIRLVCEWALKDNEIEKAIIRLDRYLSGQSNDADIQMWLAKFLYFSGRFEQAKMRIEMALRLNPDLAGGRDVLQVIIEELRARENFEK